MRVAVIDIGTYSVRWLIAEISRRNSLKFLHTEGQITALGKGLSAEANLLTSESIAETLTAVKKGIVRAKDMGAEHIFLLGTEALRRAENTEQLASALPISLKILTIEEEAEYAFTAVRAAFPDISPLTMIDQGGGSTQIVYGSQKPEMLYLCPLGVLNLTEKFFANDPPTLKDFQKFHKMLEENLLLKVPKGIVVGMGGTITALAAMRQRLKRYDSAKVHGFRLQKSVLEGWLRRSAFLPLSQRIMMPLIDEKRAYVLPAGVYQWLFLYNLLDVDYVIVSEWGMRHGFLLRWAFEQIGPALTASG